jgi:thiamine-phosphate pyrophosphorylase
MKSRRLSAPPRGLSAPLRGLYAVTPEATEARTLLLQVTAALEGGISALQYRRKQRAGAEEATALAGLCRRAGVLFIVNDDIDIALACDADGVHLGREDGDLATARSKLGTKLLGVSCYNALDRARAAVTAGADYVAFGSVFASPTKPAAVRAPLSLFAEAKSLAVPLVAIGGITLENAPQSLDAGAHALAVVSDLFDAPDIAARARAYGKLFRT